MGEKYDEVTRRNRRRIAGLAAAGFMNYWVAALLFVIAATLGTLIAFIVQGIAEGDRGNTGDADRVHRSGDRRGR